MKKILTVSSLCVLCMLVLSFGAEAQEKAIRIGDKIPGFFLKDLNGESFFLRDYVGEKAKKNLKAMIFSLSASYCKPCKKEIPELGKMMEKYKDKGLEIYIIAIEKEEQALKLVAETKTAIPVLLDKYLMVPKLLGHESIPFTLLIDSEGTVKFINTGFSEENAMEFIERFENEVVALLDIEKKPE
ncbi:MAG: redoxin domain-containing protein [Candidatus Latescibacteria bacterium]|jgi:thiol-disulfide isomerase/thioredoxin|nr:redoxin domain-containing protein [Candidatus Latescibacterota bacterium]